MVEAVANSNKLIEHLRHARMGQHLAKRFTVRCFPSKHPPKSMRPVRPSPANALLSRPYRPTCPQLTFALVKSIQVCIDRVVGPLDDVRVKHVAQPR